MPTCGPSTARLSFLPFGFFGSDAGGTAVPSLLGNTVLALPTPRARRPLVLHPRPSSSVEPVAHSGHNGICRYSLWLGLVYEAVRPPPQACSQWTQWRPPRVQKRQHLGGERGIHCARDCGCFDWRVLYHLCQYNFLRHDRQNQRTNTRKGANLAFLVGYRSSEEIQGTLPRE